jgi:molybdopterin synthase catalytic subunit
MCKNVLINGPVTQIKISSFLKALDKKADSGGHSVFLGQVRADIVRGKRVLAIEYSAYEAIVKAEADKIVKQVCSEFNDVRSIEFLHSVGIVKAGKISLLVLVSAGHRKHAIEACTKTVELIKEKLPIWKKEIFEDSSYEWK